MEPMAFYHFEKDPFKKETCLKSIFPSEDAQNIKSRLDYLCRNRGIGVFTGAAGTGKTSAVREYVKGLNPALYKVVYMKLSTISTVEFYRQLANSLGLEVQFKKADMFRSIQAEITRLCREKRCLPIIIIDESQYLKNDILKDLVMLLNFDMDSRDDCVLIFCGLNSFNNTLKKGINEPLRQRIIVNCTAQGLRQDEVERYIKWMLKECGGEENLFSPAAIEAAYRNSQGSIRVLNKILSYALIDGTNDKSLQISEENVLKAVLEMQLE